MSHLFAEVYLDEDVSVLVADLVRGRGFRVITTRDTGQLGRTDSEQLRYATDRRMAILTHNRVDFEALHRQYLAEGQTHWGILISARRHSHQVALNLSRILNRLTADELQNQLFYI